MDPDGTIQSFPLITAHQAAREGIFFDDGDAQVQQGKDDPYRQSPDTGTDDKRIKRFICFHRRHLFRIAYFTRLFRTKAKATTPVSLVSIFTP